MSEHFAWYVSRATGIVSWGLLIASMLWGLCYATRILGRRARPWWMLGVHRFLGGLAVIFVIVHVVAIMLNSYVHFGIADVLIPFATSWHPIPVALGIVGAYLMVAIELTSLAQRHLARSVWRQIHLASYWVFGLATVHAVTAGTDTKAVLAGGATVGIATVAVLLGALGWVSRSEGRESRTPTAGRVPSRV